MMFENHRQPMQQLNERVQGDTRDQLAANLQRAFPVGSDGSFASLLRALDEAVGR